MNRSDVETFFRTLLLGDFEENQSSAALVVGGLLGLIPILDQVLDARDVSGTLFKINQAGGFNRASTDQIVNFGFAAFGAIPEVGSVFKGVFKPLYKQRKAAKGAVHSGLHGVEAMLGMKKGGAIAWIRKELIGKWAARTQGAIATANAALAATIELTEFLATASGWKDYLVPDSIQELAKQLLPGLKGLRGQLAAPIQRASNEIREFLEDLLGEQAAAIVMQVGSTAVQASAVPGTRTRAGHNAAAVRPHGSSPVRQGKQEVQGKPKVDQKGGAGGSHSSLQNTAGKLVDITNAALGVSGEHIADYICANKFGWGQAWSGHDKGAAGSWRTKPGTTNPGKLSKGGSPKVTGVLYKLTDGANGTGLDAVWRAEGHNEGKPYAIVEAKASTDEDAKKFQRLAKRKPGITSKLGVSGAVDASDLLEPLEDATATSKPGGGKAGGGKPGGGGKPTGVASGTGKPKALAGTSANQGTTSAPTAKAKGVKPVMVQMSHEWIEANIGTAVDRTISNEILIKKSKVYSRHLFFSPLYHPSAAQHAAARSSGAAETEHRDHDAIHYNDGEIKMAVNKRKASLRKRHGNLASLAVES
jgi:hypothetical protein